MYRMHIRSRHTPRYPHSHYRHVLVLLLSGVDAIQMVMQRGTLDSIIMFEIYECDCKIDKSKKE